MKLQFKHQKFQADAAKAVVDVFAGQPYLTPTYMIEHFNAQKHSCQDLQFSVLQVLSKAMSKEQIIDAETLWKKKLLTYEPFGLGRSDRRGDLAN